MKTNQLESVIQREIEDVELEIENRALLSTNALPEPSYPPPPPPPPFNQQPTRASDEPIYEAVLPRDEDNGSPPPLPTPPHKLSMAKSPIAVETETHRPTSPIAALSSPRQSRPSSRSSGTGVRDKRFFFFSR